MTIQGILNERVADLEAKKRAKLQRLAELRETKETRELEKLKLEHVLHSLNVYIGDCFPQSSGTADEDWRDQEEQIVHTLFQQVQEHDWHLWKIEADICGLERELAIILHELSLCTRASIEDRTYLQT